MGRKSRCKKGKRIQKPKVKVFPIKSKSHKSWISQSEIDSAFFGPLEVLTDKLIKELCEEEWDKEALLYHREQGRKYNRKHDSIM